MVHTFMHYNPLFDRATYERAPSTEHSQAGRQIQDILYRVEPEVPDHRSTVKIFAGSRMDHPPAATGHSRFGSSTPTLTRATSDKQWIIDMYQHIEDETDIRGPRFRVNTLPLADVEVVVEEPMSQPGVIKLSDAWNLWDYRLKKRAVVQIREKIKALRSIKPKDIPHRPIIADRFISRLGSNPANQERDYKNNQEFVKILKDSVAAVAYDPDLNRDAVKYIQQLAGFSSELVFTHGNLTADNIYVNPATGDVAGIANWSEAGYYPIYWEFVKAKLSYNSEPNFERDEAVEMIMDPWWVALALIKPANDMIF